MERKTFLVFLGLADGDEAMRSEALKCTSNVQYWNWNARTNTVLFLFRERMVLEENIMLRF